MKPKGLKKLYKHLRWVQREGHLISIDNKFQYEDDKSFDSWQTLKDAITKQIITITINYK